MLLAFLDKAAPCYLPANAVLSPLKGLTSVFGMVTGVSPSLWAPPPVLLCQSAANERSSLRPDLLSDHFVSRRSLSRFAVLVCTASAAARYFLVLISSIKAWNRRRRKRTKTGVQVGLLINLGFLACRVLYEFDSHRLLVK